MSTFINFFIKIKIKNYFFREPIIILILSEQYWKIDLKIKENNLNMVLHLLQLWYHIMNELKDMMVHFIIFKLIKKNVISINQDS